jgi:SAM-dependent methyltransferase
VVVNNEFENSTTWVDPVSMDYHFKQWEEPKRSTIAFNDFFSEEIKSAKSILDIGAGAGAATSYIASKNPRIKFKGIDISPELIDIANTAVVTKKMNSNQISFEVGDWFDLKQSVEKIDGVISLQTISWISEIRKPLEEVFTKISPNWLGMSGLFFDGDISCKTEVFEHVKNRKVYYNTYSIKEVRRIAEEFGYNLIKAAPFQIDIDIAKSPNLDIMGTYTRLTIGDKTERLQISGPLLLNWYFVLIKKIE